MDAVTTGAREQLDSDQLERLQNRITKLESLIQACPFAVGVKVTVAVGTSATQVAHRLGKKPTGLLVLSETPAAAVGFSATQPTDVKNFVNVTASVATTCAIWFF